MNLFNLTILLVSIMGISSQECVFKNCDCSNIPYIRCDSTGQDGALPANKFPQRTDAYTYYVKTVTFTSFSVNPQANAFNGLDLGNLELFHMNTKNPMVSGTFTDSKIGALHMIYDETPNIEAETFAPIADSLTTLSIEISNELLEPYAGQLFENIALLQKLHHLQIKANLTKVERKF